MTSCILHENLWNNEYKQILWDCGQTDFCLSGGGGGGGWMRSECSWMLFYIGILKIIFARAPGS